jgi:DNA-3-methyladenine glycosylase II
LIPVVPPYRLDLTVAVLRRFSTNLVDRFTADGRYLRALETADGSAVIELRMAAPDRIALRLHKVRGDTDALATRAAAIVGADQTLDIFNEAAQQLSWLAPLAGRMRGVRPPRYPTFWEAAVNGVIFQQISIIAAGAIIGRFVARLGRTLRLGDEPLFTFPEPERVATEDTDALRAIGLSAVKIATLRQIAAELASGLDERTLESLPTDDLIERLQQIKGIGPWTSALVALRGFGRLDLFPSGDSGIKHGLQAIAGDVSVELAPALRALGAQRAMLYYHFLLARLEAAGTLEARPTLDTI